MPHPKAFILSSSTINNSVTVVAWIYYNIPTAPWTIITTF